MLQNEKNYCFAVRMEWVKERVRPSIKRLKTWLQYLLRCEETLEASSLVGANRVIMLLWERIRDDQKCLKKQASVSIETIEAWILSRN